MHLGQFWKGKYYFVRISLLWLDESIKFSKKLAIVQMQFWNFKRRGVEEGLKYTYFWHKMLLGSCCCWLQWSSHFQSPNNGYPRGRQRPEFHFLRHVSSGGHWGNWSLFCAWLWLLRIKVQSKLVVCPKLMYWTWKSFSEKRKRMGKCWRHFSF